MKPLKFSIFVLFLGVLVSPNIGHSTDLFFAPKRIDVSDKKQITELRVTNRSDLTKSYQISLSDVVMTEAGVTTRVDGFDYSARRMVRFVPRQFSLAPGKQQVVRVMARISPDKPDGEYHSHLEFLEDVSRRAELNPSNDANPRASAKAQVTFSTAIPITLSKGEISTTIGMENPVLGEDDKGMPVINMVLTRSGNGQGNALIEVHYITPDGQVISTGPRRHVYAYREIDRRDYTLGIQLADGAPIQKGGMFKIRLFNKDVSETDPVQEEMLTVD